METKKEDYVIVTGETELKAFDKGRKMFDPSISGYFKCEVISKTDTEATVKVIKVPPLTPAEAAAYRQSLSLPPIVTCPYCKSTDTKKISGLSKAGSVAVWGIFAAGKVSKQWKCGKCKSEF